MVTLKLIDCEALRLEAKLISLVEEIEGLRSVMRARKIAGVLQEPDLCRFMKVDAEIERVTAALRMRFSRPK